MNKQDDLSRELCEKVILKWQEEEEKKNEAIQQGKSITILYLIVLINIFYNKYKVCWLENNVIN